MVSHSSSSSTKYQEEKKRVKAWREKNQKKAKKIKNQAKTISRNEKALDKERELRKGLSCEISMAIERIENLKKNELSLMSTIEDQKKQLQELNLKVFEAIPNASHKEQTMVLAVLTFILGGISFRATSRMLSLFKSSATCHYTSIKRWACRVGLGLLLNVGRINKKWIAVIDETLDFSGTKILVIGRIPLDCLDRKQGGVQLDDLEVIHLEVRTRWKGEDVAKAMTSCFKKVGRPTLILKDGGTNLKKGHHLWQRQQINKETKKSISIPAIQDIGHVAANALKEEFSKTDMYLKFLKWTQECRESLRHSELAGLCPPKIRVKGRFQSITAVAKWGTRILELRGGAGQLQEGTYGCRLRELTGNITPHRRFIEKFNESSVVIETVSKELKKNGLNEVTAEKTRFLLMELGSQNLVRKRLLQWLEDHLKILRKLKGPSCNLPISSDIIESLFGRFKSIVANSGHIELATIAPIIPCLCGKLSPVKILAALRSFLNKDLENHKKEVESKSISRQRRRFQKGEIVPYEVSQAIKITTKNRNNGGRFPMKN